MRRRIVVVSGVLFVLGLFAFAYFSRFGMSRAELFVGNAEKDISSPSNGEFCTGAECCREGTAFLHGDIRGRYDV